MDTAMGVLLAGIVTAAVPDARRYARDPIAFRGGPGHSAAVFVPYFPDAAFRLNLPEQVGVAG